MNAEEVVAMIDAITEGKTYGLTPRVTEASDELNFTFEKDEINIFSGERFAAAINDTRTAREIAGALIAWANRKDGRIIGFPDLIEAGVPQFVKGSVRSLDTYTTKELHELLTRGIPTDVGRRQVEEEIDRRKCKDPLTRSAPSIRDWHEIKAGLQTRANWYRAHSPHMSQEAKDRNLRALKLVQDRMSTDSLEWEDIQEAIRILKENGAIDNV